MINKIGEGAKLMKLKVEQNILSENNDFSSKSREPVSRS